MPGLRQIQAVVFDVGETLIDETRAWTEAAEAVGCPALTVLGVLGALIERDEDHRNVWQALEVKAPPASRVEPRDFYPDAVPTLKALQAAGYRVGIAGNQPAGVVEQLEQLGLPADFVASSASWGVSKPSSEFFSRVIAEAGVPASTIAYVGDRLDNDVIPATKAGMFAIFVVRGPWAHIHQHRPEAKTAALTATSLAEISRALGA